MAGRPVLGGEMVWTPAPAMLNSMVSVVPTVALAALMASRREQCVASHVPSFASFAELTVKVVVGAVAQLLRRTETSLLAVLATAKSGAASALKSAMNTELGMLPAPKCVAAPKPPA